MTRRTAPISYRQAQREARAIERDLLGRIGAELDRALRQAAERLEALLLRLPGSTPETRIKALRAAADVFRFQRQRLVVEMERAITEGRVTGYADVIAAWQEAARRAATTVGLSLASLGAVLTPRTTLLAVYENVGGAKLFRSLLARAADDGFLAVDDILRAGILEGKSFEKLARELRPFVQGATGGGAAGDVTAAAAFRTVRYNAARIAYSEIHNARAEAEVQHFALDPLIEAVAWRLSPDRGTLRGPDACDALAENDFYGLGAGVYPVDAVPLPPHPFDRSLAAWTPVLTETGWRRVDQVRAGERVLTHRGRWGEVSESLAGRITGGWMRLRTADGRVLELTDDHPVLLVSGCWTLAGDLRAGDFLVATRDLPDHVGEPGVGIGPARTREAIAVEDVKRPPRSAQRGRFRRVLATLVRSMMPAAMYLKREPLCRDSDVDVEPREGIQRMGGNAVAAQAVKYGAFVDAEALVAVDRRGAFAASGFGLRMPSEQSTTPRGAFAPLGGCHALANQDVGFLATASGNAPLGEPGANGAAVNVAASSHLGFTEALVDIPVRDLIPVELVEVHTLRVYARRYCLTVAKDKSFIAGGLVVHNCERVPITRPLARAGDPKPSPGLQTSTVDVAGGAAMSDAARRAMEQSTFAALTGNQVANQLVRQLISA